MVCNISYNNKKIKNLINESLGQAYGFIDKIKLGGIGSQRLKIKDASLDINSLINKNSNTNLCSILYNNINRPNSTLRDIDGLTALMVAVIKSMESAENLNKNELSYKDLSFINELIRFSRGPEEESLQNLLAIVDNNGETVRDYIHDWEQNNPPIAINFNPDDVPFFERMINIASV